MDSEWAISLTLVCLSPPPATYRCCIVQRGLTEESSVQALKEMRDAGIAIIDSTGVGRR
jgi:hypothetical protein